VLELSKELGQHNLLIERAIEKENRLLLKVQRIEDLIMEKELYNYQRIQEQIAAEKRNEARAKAAKA
jgi:hypothetical protein